MKRIVRIATVACLASALVTGVQAQTWPDRPVKMLVLSGAGGSPDVATRAISQELSQTLGRQFVVENKVGAGGIVGLSALKASAPDGYTFALAPASSIVIAPRLFKDVPFDTEKDFAPVAFIGKTPIVIAVKKDSPYKTFEDLKKASQQAKEPIPVGTTSINSLPHLLGELSARKAGAKIFTVPFSTGSQAVTALLGGDVQALIDGSPSFEGMVRSGELRLLASYADKRQFGKKELPTVAENAPGLTATGWFGVFAPRDTPPQIVDKLRTAINSAMAKPEIEERLVSLNIFPERMTGADYSAFLAREQSFWAEALKDVGAKSQ
jgi:tripartite-type tricarboxylate transporter receptor subunit TctC